MFTFTAIQGSYDLCYYIALYWHLLQYCAKVMQTCFSEIGDFSWPFDKKISNSRWKQKVRIICGAYCLQLRRFSNDNLFGMKGDFKFSSEKSLCLINDLEHMSEISLFISSAQTFPSILRTTICQVRSCRNDSFVLSSH